MLMQKARHYKVECEGRNAEKTNGLKTLNTELETIKKVQDPENYRSTKQAPLEQLYQDITSFTDAENTFLLKMKCFKDLVAIILRLSRMSIIF